MTLLDEHMIERRNRWIDEIGALSGEFTENASHIEDKLLEAIRNTGIAVLLEHLRLCSAIGELVTTRKIDSRIEQIESVEINTLMDVHS